uniref:Uncharacterized protein n=1 Tax=Phlebotomus papatasi TaxID=29031 RepID=A0A1B0EVH2_PHLPP
THYGRFLTIKYRFQDRFYLSAVEKRWHAGCLQCCMCRQLLEGETSCYSRDENIYCKTDYYRYVSFLAHFPLFPNESLCISWFHVRRKFISDRLSQDHLLITSEHRLQFVFH